MKDLVFIFSVALMLVGCRGYDSCERLDCPPPIYPDYTDIAIPENIAPLNFFLDRADAVSLKIKGGNGCYEFSSRNRKVSFGLKKWREMLSSESGCTLVVCLRAKIDGKYVEYLPFTWEVRPEKIDRYISYRLIEPAYEMWNVLSIEERCTESFKASSIAENQVTGRSCMNCHTSNRAAMQTTFFHARSRGGATIYQRGGKIRKIDTATDSTAGPAVYGEISQDGRFGIYTTADIRNGLHSAALERFEVFDASSDLILIDFENNTVTDSPLVKGPEYQETFPCWSADGRTIYFCRAKALAQPEQTREMHYDLYSISFDPESGRLGDDLNLVFDATSLGKSVSFPKCSPDGKKILFTVSDYGTFPIWHVEADLWMLDIESGTVDRMEATNGEFSDSYHCWSSTGRWICWASKRGDRVYGRPYFAFVKEDGTTAKGFVLPQKNPDKYLITFKSYNIPELYDEPEPYDAWDVSRFYREMDTETMRYVR